MEPITIGLIITGCITGVTLILQFIQSAKIHDIQISSCMTNKTTNNYKKNSSSDDIKKRKKKRKKRNSI